MKYIQKDINIYIEIKATVFNKIQLQAESEYPNENGGMLLGHYSSDRHTAYIDDVIVPYKKTTGRCTFTRTYKGQEKMLEEQNQKGLYFIGEWHSHPDGTTFYSSADLNTISEIETEVKNDNPILLIIGVQNNVVTTHTFYCYKFKQLLKFEKMIDLKELFMGLQQQMLTSLNTNRAFISHPGSKGDATENHWITFLRTYLPNRYTIDKAIVIDAYGNVSEQIDIVIYDVTYTPFIFNQDGFKYIPAESVYGVFEVKQDIKNNIEYAAKKIESVRKLIRTSSKMIASGKKTEARHLTKMIGGILTTTNSYADNNTITEQLKKLKGYQTIDLGCCCDSGSFYVDYNEIEVDDSILKDNIDIMREKIQEVYQSREVKEIKFSNKEVSLFTFFLQLVSYLKSIGTVPAIDINEYLKAIDEKVDIDI